MISFRLGGSVHNEPTFRGIAVVGAVVVLLAASSMMPFMRLTAGMPSMAPGAQVDALLFLGTWIPFVGLLLGYDRTAGQRLSFAQSGLGYLALLLLAPPLHALMFMGVRGRSGPDLSSTAGAVEFQILSVLGVLQYLVIVAVLFAVSSGRAASRERARAAEERAMRADVERALARSRIEALQMQLQPHFLFNTLTSISALVADDPRAAQRMIAKLSELLRAVLADTEQVTVPLRRELQLIEAYLDIQRLRFGDALDVSVEIDARSPDALVPSMILQPLVENAVKHAVETRIDGGRIDIRASVAGERLALTVRDSGAPQAAARPVNGFGVGWRNTIDRLNHLYGSRHSFGLEQSPDGSHTARIELPFTTADAAV